MRHPFDFCAVRNFCFCCCLDQEVTCYIIAIICILANGFSGVTNFGMGHWSVNVTSIVNLLIHLGAGTILFMGTLWGKVCLKIGYCWILFLGMITVLLGLVSFFLTYEANYLISTGERGEKSSFLFVGLNACWLVFWDVYSTMVVLGNTEVVDDLYPDSSKTEWGGEEITHFWSRPIRSRRIAEFLEMADSSVEEEIFFLHKEGRWEEILEKFGRNKFLHWIWPEKKNLNFIAKSVRDQGSNSIVSIGCGSGLLEWLLEKATGIDVIGIEIDGVWWKSKYSSGTFIPLVLSKNPEKGELEMNTNNSALLFCYFNNLKAFLRYVENFRGRCLIVIGPGRGRGTYAIPEPFKLPEEITGSWILIDRQEIRSSRDFVAVYAKKS